MAAFVDASRQAATSRGSSFPPWTSAQAAIARAVAASAAPELDSRRSSLCVAALQGFVRQPHGPHGLLQDSGGDAFEVSLARDSLVRGETAKRSGSTRQHPHRERSRSESIRSRPIASKRWVGRELDKPLGGREQTPRHRPTFRLTDARLARAISDRRVDLDGLLGARQRRPNVAFDEVAARQYDREARALFVMRRGPRGTERPTGTRRGR